MIGYVTLGTDDLERARTFFDGLFEVIGAKRLLELPEQRGFTMWGKSFDRPAVVVIRPVNGAPADPGNGNMVALAMSSKEIVDAVYARALELGGTSEGEPGFRGDPKIGRYFAYFRDPDGHKFAAFSIQPQT
jgi:catechol 2,3-dioxygenase-like lactoylglutathione lyase family enzyme